jgi:hypothetical protein
MDLTVQSVRHNIDFPWRDCSLSSIADLATAFRFNNDLGRPNGWYRRANAPASFDFKKGNEIEIRPVLRDAKPVFSIDS